MTKIETEEVEIQDSDIPAALRKEEAQLHKQINAAPGQEQTVYESIPEESMWTDEVVCGLIDIVGNLIKTRAERAGSRLLSKKEYLATHTTPVLKKYLPGFQWGIEVDCALAWSLVGLEIFQEWKDEQATKKKSIATIQELPQ